MSITDFFFSLCKITAYSAIFAAQLPAQFTIGGHVIFAITQLYKRNTAFYSLFYLYNKDTVKSAYNEPT